MGESKRKGEATFGSILKALNDLAKVQKGMLEGLKQHNRDKSIHFEFLIRETSGVSQQCDHPLPATHPLAFSRPTSITMPTFLPPVPSEQGRWHDHIPMGDYFREWQSMGENFKAALSEITASSSRMKKEGTVGGLGHKV